MNRIISCDWGTSSFRIRLIDGATRAVLSEIKSHLGIAATFDSWQKSGLGADRRLLFYQSLLLEQIQLLGPGVAGLPLIISGMASSTLGMMELSYKDCPFDTSGRDLSRFDLPPTREFPYPLTLVSGVRTASDVMRGEETLLIGAVADRGGPKDEPEGSGSIYIFPGTHSKHVHVKSERATHFSTYMTGEFYSLLSQHSILAASLTRGEGTLSAGFEKGVEDSGGAGILNRAFGVRTNQLFNKLSKEENDHYLSGLLIGAELNELDLPVTTHHSQLTLVASGPLKEAYTRALHHLGHRGFNIIDAGHALIAAHCKILNLA